MKTSTQYPRANSAGFTLIEMIGVLAVIAILASLLIPKIFEAINNARVNNAAVTCNTVKAAVADHYAKFGALNVNGSSGTPVVLTSSLDYDEILLSEGFLDKPFATKIGSGTTGTTVQLVANEAQATTPDGSNAAYDLDGVATPFANDAGTGATAGTGHVVQAVILGVTELDAREFNNRMDGPLLGTTTGADLLGRVKYAAATAGVTDVYVYITHR